MHVLKSCGRAGSAFFVVLLAAVGRLAKNDEMYEFPPISSSGWYLTLFLTVVYRLSTIKFLRHYFGQDFPVPQAMRTILTKDTPAMVCSHSQEAGDVASLKSKCRDR